MAEGAFVLFILGAVAVAGLVFVAKILFVIVLAKQVIKAYQAPLGAIHADVQALEALAGQSGAPRQWQGLLQAAHEMESAASMRARHGSSSGVPVPTAFMNAWAKGQREIAQLDNVRRELAEVRMADIKSQAASMGLFL